MAGLGIDYEVFRGERGEKEKTLFFNAELRSDMFVFKSVYFLKGTFVLLLKLPIVGAQIGRWNITKSYLSM